MEYDLTGLAFYRLQFYIEDEQIFSTTTYGAPALKVGDVVHLVKMEAFDYDIRGDFKITNIVYSFENHGKSHAIYIEYLVEEVKE